MVKVIQFAKENGIIITDDDSYTNILYLWAIYEKTWFFKIIP